ncbi:MAG: hypothetical protein QM734_01040 [Cyclobacteriaceae bacterium]
MRQSKSVLRFFRLNDPYRLFGVLLVMTLMALPLFINEPANTVSELKTIILGETLNAGKTMYSQVVDDTPWLAAGFAKCVDFMFGRSLLARHILALLLLFFQAAFFSFILIRNRAYNENNYLPALIFGLLCFFSFDMLTLSNELLASTFVLFALNNLFKEIEFKVQRDEIVLNLGFFLGLASLFVFSFGIFLIGSLVVLLVFARLDLRKSLMLFFGFLLPHLLLLTLYYFRENLPEIGSYFYGTNFTFHTIDFISWKSMMWLGSAIVIYFLFSMIMLGREARFTKYQGQLLQVMLLWLLISFIGIIIARERSPHSFITLIPSLTYFISHYLLLIRRKWIAEIMLWIFLISIVGISTTARFQRFQKVDYSNLFLKKSEYDFVNKKVLILNDEIEVYQNNRVASFFLNWNLSQNIFQLNDYYHDLVLIEESFQMDPPDIIIDEKNLMKKVFSRLPDLQKRYERKGIFYKRKSN